MDLLSGRFDLGVASVASLLAVVQLDEAVVLTSLRSNSGSVFHVDMMFCTSFKFPLHFLQISLALLRAHLQIVQLVKLSRVS